MRRLLLLLSLMPILSFAQDGHVVVQPDIHCFLYKSAVDSLKNKYGEEPVFIGKSDIELDTVTMMFINQETGSYTVITTDRKIACIMDMGSQVIYRLPKALKSKTM